VKGVKLNGTTGARSRGTVDPAEGNGVGTSPDEALGVGFRLVELDAVLDGAAEEEMDALILALSVEETGRADEMLDAVETDETATALVADTDADSELAWV